VTILGIDLGARRIGLAVSDAEERIAFPAGVLESAGRRKDLAALRTLVAERGVRRIVVGLPVHMSGREGPEAAAARAFARELQEAAGVPVETLDERWTSLEAERALRETGDGARARRRGKGRRKGKGAVDELAATILLRTFLERRAVAAEPGA
jgi:putative Holliday junction resolvase